MSDREQSGPSIAGRVLAVAQIASLIGIREFAS
jgi:hypothetical protein